MADDFGQAATSDYRDPAERGSLTIKDKVVERLAAKAALDTDGVLPRSAGLDKLTGRDLPRVRVQISGDRVRAGVDVAARWPVPLPALTASVRRNVARALSTMGGLHVDGVDVTVPAVIVDPARSDVRSDGSTTT